MDGMMGSLPGAAEQQAAREVLAASTDASRAR